MEAFQTGHATGFNAKPLLLKELLLTFADAFGLPYDGIDLLEKPCPENPLKCGSDSPGEQDAKQVDRHLAMSAHRDGSAQLLDLDNGCCIQSFEDHGAPVSAAACLPDGNLVLTAAGTVLRLWEVESGSCTQMLRVHSAQVTSAVFCHGEVLSGSDDGTAKLSSWATGQVLLTLRHGSAVRAVAAWEEGCCAATLTEGCLSSWCLASGKRLWRHTAESRCAPRFLKGGALLYLAEPHECVLAEPDSGAMLQTFRVPHLGVTAPQYDIYGFASLAGSPDSRLVLTQSWSGQLRIWSRRTGECVQLLETPQPMETADFLEDGRRVLVASEGKGTAVWDLRSGQRESVKLGSMPRAAVVHARLAEASL